MDFNEISNLRLVNQQIFHPDFKSVKDTIKELCAIQAQDFNMSKWAIGVRLPLSIDKTIETAFNKAEILRTHLLRPTWHIVSAKDIYWLLELTAPQIKSALKSRHRELEITKHVIKKSKQVIENSLLENHNLSRNELIGKLENSKIKTDKNRASHIFLMAELDGLICSGIITKKKQTYALLEERVPAKKILYKDEALAELAKRYFTTRGPATVQDFAWWSGLPMSDSRNALEIIKGSLNSETVNSKTFWFKYSFSDFENKKDVIFLLPAFDEFIISYRDRSAAITQQNFSKAVSNNGIFRPVIVYRGNVTGIWRPVRKKEKVLIEIKFFKLPGNSMKKLIKKASSDFGKFLEKEIEITYLTL